MARVIDLHTHVVPAHIAADPARDALWPSVAAADADGASVIVAGKLFRAIDSRCWDTERRLADMAREGVDVQVLSPMPELLSHWLAPDDAEHLSRLVNAQIAAMVAQAPDRFVGLGMVPAQDPNRAAALLREVGRLGLAGIEIGTHIDNVPLGDRSLWPIYDAAQALDLAIFVHPLRPCGLERIGGAAELGVVATFPLEIAAAALSLFAGGVLQAFPRLRVLLSHGGGALASLLGRVEAVRGLLPPVQAVLGADAWTLARRFWYDSNVYDADTLRFLAAKMGRDRLVVGSDYPFPIRQERPGAFVEHALPGSMEQCGCNAAAFLFGDRTDRAAALAG